MAGRISYGAMISTAKTVSVIAGNGNESIDDGRYPDNSLSQPSGLSAAGGKLYFVDAETSSLRVYENGEVKTLIGTGLFDFGYKEGKQGQSAACSIRWACLPMTAEVYVADSYNHSIRRYDPATGMLSNFAGHGARGNKDGALAACRIQRAECAVLQVGDKLYVADTNNNAIRVIDLDDHFVSTLELSEAPRAVAAPEFSAQLPNLEKTDAIGIAASAPVAVEFTLQKGWHINQYAPSFLALFDMSAKTQPKAIASFDPGDLHNQRVALPALSGGGPYRLQGTLYYCQVEEGEQCLLKSFDIPVTIKSGGKKRLC